MSLFDQIVARDRAASQSPPSRRKAFPQSTTGSQRRRHLTKPLRIHAGTGGVVSPSTSPRSSVAGDDEDLGHVQHHRYDRHNGHDGIDDHDDGEVEAEQHSQGEEHCANQHATDRQQQQQQQQQQQHAFRALGAKQVEEAFGRCDTASPATFIRKLEAHLEHARISDECFGQGTEGEAPESGERGAHVADGTDADTHEDSEDVEGLGVSADAAALRKMRQSMEVEVGGDQVEAVQQAMASGGMLANMSRSRKSSRATLSVAAKSTAL